MSRVELEGLPQAWPSDPSWFWHGEQVLALLDQYRPIVCVELGTWKGGSAIPTARVVRAWGGHVTCVDAWEMNVGPEWYRTFGGGVSLAECARNVVAAGVNANVRFVQAATVEAARYWSEPIDFLYVDADHSYEGCSADLQAWWPHLKVGGLLAGDDYDDPRQPGVTQAWDELEAQYQQAFERRATPGTNPACTRLVWGVKR
jgi:predicted O-methyltransferase YrrM